MKSACMICLSFVLCSCVVLVAQESSPANVPGREEIERAKQSLADHKYKDALEALKRADKSQNGSCWECNLLAAETYIRMHDERHALEHCDKAIETAQTDRARALSHDMKGVLLFRSAGTDTGKLRRAESELRAAVKLESQSAVFHLNLARVLLRLSEDDTAKQELRTCIDCNPEPDLKGEAQRLLTNPQRGREQVAPDFEITTLQGEKISLQALTGRVVVMDFWATWCPPCRESVPELKELTRRYPSEKLVLISISADKDDKAWREFVAKRKMDWAQYRDTDNHVLEAFGIRSFPTYMVIDGDGIIKQRLTGLNPQQTVAHRLKAVLGQMPQLEGEVHK